jgi:hypothetical protein
MVPVANVTFGESTSEISVKIWAALPDGWRCGDMSVGYFRDESAPIYSVVFYTGYELEGGRTRHYDGKTAIEKTYRRIEVEARGKTGAELAAVAARLPDLTALGSLPYPIEFKITGDLFP